MPTVTEQIETLRSLVNDHKFDERSGEFASSLIGFYDRKGFVTEKQYPHLQKLIDRANGIVPEREKVAVGDLAGIVSLFDKAKTHLNKPAIVLIVGYADEAMEEPCLVRVTVAGAKARVPGSLNVADYDVPNDQQTWYGRVLRDGNFELSPRLDDADKENVKFVAEKLREFACDPVGVATEFGKLTGRCCFCNRKLTTVESTAVGYGPDCAEHYGLPWGAKPTTFAESALPEKKVTVRTSRRSVKLHKEHTHV